MTILSTGFERKKIVEIKTEYDALVTEALGAVNTAPDSVIGQLEGIWAEGLDNANEVLQDTYDSMYPTTAEGTSLDGAVAFIGLVRKPATETVVTVAAYGDEGAVVLAGSFARADIQYKATSDVTISRSNALDVTVEIVTVENNATYNILSGGVSQNYVSDASATRSEIAAGFVALFNSGIFKAELVGTETFRIYALDLVTPFAITVDAKLNIFKRASPIVYIALETGANACPANALVNIETPALGLNSITNLKAGVVGSNTESDSELRARHAKSVRVTGSATVEAIKARMLQDVPEVTSIRIYENRTNLIDIFGAPPHSFESVIVGGVDSDVANQLWLTKPAGIETHGNVTNNVLDSAGDTQIIKFSRSAVKYGWLTIAAELYAEETLPATAEALIKSACVAYANENIGTGDDIIIQRFCGAIYEAVSGIGGLTMTASVTNAPGDMPTYTATNIPVSRTETVVFDVSRITLTGV